MRPTAEMPIPVIEGLGYDVRVGPGLVDQLGPIVAQAAPAHRYAVITDDRVAPRWLSRVQDSFRLVEAGIMATAVPAGEASKTRDWWAGLTDWLLSNGAGRDTTIVALGGGVVGDLAGFVAATYLRGIPVVQVPTSLLAMVDASIGGKTGVDTPMGKNLVGAFHQPAAVVVDPATLSTLPAEHLRAGMAEVIKHGAIADAEYFRQAAVWAATVHEVTSAGRLFDWLGPQTLHVIGRSIQVKATVVKADPLERGPRQVLNAGHTVAHALELETDYALLHGEAVAIGLVTEAVLGERAGITEAGTAQWLREALGSAGLPTRLPAGLDPARLVAAMRSDKKSRAGQLAFALLRQVGTVAGSAVSGWSAMLDDALVREVLSDPSVRG